VVVTDHHEELKRHAADSRTALVSLLNAIVPNPTNAS